MGSRNGADSVGSRNGAGSRAGFVGSRNGAGSGADSVGSQNGAGSGADSVGSWNGAGLQAVKGGGSLPTVPPQSTRAGCCIIVSHPRRCCPSQRHQRRVPHE